MHSARVVVFGFVVAASASGCVSAFALQSATREVLDAQRDILSGTDALDQSCQQEQVDRKGLETCRTHRDKIRAALRRQVEAILTWGK